MKKEDDKKRCGSVKHNRNIVMIDRVLQFALSLQVARAKTGSGLGRAPHASMVLLRNNVAI